MNDQEQEQTSARTAAAAVWLDYDDELRAAILAGDPTAERLYAAETTLEELRLQEQEP